MYLRGAQSFILRLSAEFSFAVTRIEKTSRSENHHHLVSKAEICENILYLRWSYGLILTIQGLGDP